MSRRVDSAADWSSTNASRSSRSGCTTPRTGGAAVRHMRVLLRYGQSSGAEDALSGDAGRRLRKRSTDSVDRAMKELVRIGAARVDHRYDGAQRLTNAYHVGPRAPAATSPLSR